MNVVELKKEPSIEEELVLRAEALTERLASRAAKHDLEGSYVEENMQEAAALGLLEAGVPEELGGGGARHSSIASMLRRLARGCPATALTLSMHQHLVATVRWRWERGLGGDPLLSRVARERISLISTGAMDWLESSGSLRAVDGGYRFSGRKSFCSGAPSGSVVITSARLVDESGETLVLHFAVPKGAPGVEVVEDWDTMGMRGTGSHTIRFDDVFVPDAAVTVRRQAGVFHPSWNVVLTLAMPLIMSVYAGVAESARDLLVEMLRHDETDELTWQAVGEMENELMSCRLAVNQMVRLANDGAFEPDTDRTSEVLSCKTVAARSAMAVVRLASEISGGRSFYRSHPLERLSRDILGAQFHPLQTRPQHRFTGRVSLGLAPV